MATIDDTAASDSPNPARRTQFRTLIALTMLLIASLGAGVAGWAAITQQSTTGLERRLSQAQMMELSDRLQLTDRSRAGKALQERLDRHLADARMHRLLAQQEKAADASQARLRELKAQEALLLANVIRPFVEFLPNIIRADLTLDERRMGLASVGSLLRRGLHASWVESAGSPRIEYREKSRIEAQDEQVLSLALVVVALVLALVLLTFADLSGQRRAQGLAFYGVAVVSAVGALAAALWIDPSLVVIVGGVSSAFALFVVLAYLLGWLSAPADAAEPLQPQGIDTQGFAGGSLQIQDAAQTFSRFLIVAIALTALASSVIGYWYSAASSRSDDASYQAYEKQLSVVKRSGRATVAVLGTFEALVDLYERRVRCTAAHNQSMLARDGKLALAANVAASSERLLCEGVDTSKITDGQDKLLELDRRFGPHADPRFPLRLQQHVASATPDAVAAEALALWDGYGELTTFWNAKTTSFLASLTTVAIALYVFGQALAMVQLQVTRAMAACGVLMTLGALGWSTVTWHRSFPVGSSAAIAGCAVPQGLDRDTDRWQPDAWMKAAAHNYAIGSQRLQVAEAEAEYAAAIADLECAVAARPNLALAHHELAGAKAISQSAHKAQAFYSLPTKDRLDEIERNAKATVDIQQRLGLAANSYSLNSHAVALWGLGIRDGKLGLITSALALVDRAVSITEALEADRRTVSRDAERSVYPWLSQLPLLYMNQSLFLIANERLQEGRVAAEKAIELGAHRDWTLSGTMITATALLDVNCERLHAAERCAPIRGALAAYKRVLLGGTWNADEGKATASLQSLAIGATASGVTLATRIAGFDPDKDRLAVIWAATDPQWRVPDALTVVSPAVARAEMRIGKDRGLTYQRGILTGSGYKRCLSPGRYSAELFVNGRLAGTGTTEYRGPVMNPARLEALNLALCHPATWKPWQPSERETWSPEAMAGFVNARDEPAVFLFSFAMPEAAGSEAAEQSTYALDRALRLLAAHRVVRDGVETLSARLQPCDKVGKGDIARVVARGSGGLLHVMLVLADALDGVTSCELIGTASIMHRIPG